MKSVGIMSVSRVAGRTGGPVGGGLDIHPPSWTSRIGAGGHNAHDLLVDLATREILAKCSESVKRQAEPCQAEPTAQYDEIGWSTEIAFAGSINLFDVAPGEDRHVEQLHSARGKWGKMG
jgi:hypothetical protein